MIVISNTFKQYAQNGNDGNDDDYCSVNVQRLQKQW